MSSEGVVGQKQARVLVIDDEQMIGRTLKRALGKEHDVMVLESGAAALELLAKDRSFDLVLCDLMMPEISGMDLYEWMCGHAAELTHRVVFMTGGTFTQRSREFLSNGQIPYVEKPFDMQALRGLIRDRLATV